MRLNDIINNYNINDFNIKKIEYKDSSIYMYISFDIEMNYIANGCRPEYDDELVHLFIFSNQDYIDNINSDVYINRYVYDNNILSLYINNKEIIIKDCDVKIINNIDTKS